MSCKSITCLLCTLVAVAISTDSTGEDGENYISVPDPQVRVHLSRTDDAELSTAEPAETIMDSTGVDRGAAEGAAVALVVGDTRVVERSSTSSPGSPAQTSTPLSEDNRTTPTEPHSDHSNHGRTLVAAASSATPLPSVSSAGNDVSPLCWSASLENRTSSHPATQPHSNHRGRQSPTTTAPTTVAQTITETDDAHISFLRRLPPEEKTRRLIEAAKKGSVGELQALLAAGTDVEVKDEWRMTALHYAAWKGHVEAVRRLLAAGAVVDSEDRGQGTPLHWAAYTGHAAVVRLLLAAGADHSARTADGRTPLHWAAVRGQAEAAAALLEAGADRAARDDRGQTPLDDARGKNHQQLVELLDGRQQSVTTRLE